MLNKVISTYRRRGFRGVWAASRQRLMPRPADCYRIVQERLRGSHGLEIGGPSGIFQDRAALPLYPIVGSLDCVTFAQETLWEGKLQHGSDFVYSKQRQAGKQFICDGSDLKSISPDSYDVVMSSHVIEHIANPLRALEEWSRVLRPGGTMLLVAPHYSDIYDHRRPVTQLKHLLADQANATPESDLTHLAESLMLHDFDWDPASLRAEEFKKMAIDNLQFRVLHHHVFDRQLVGDMLQAVGLEVESVEWCHPCHIIAIARKRALLRPPSDMKS